MFAPLFWGHFWSLFGWELCIIKHFNCIFKILKMSNKIFEIRQLRNNYILTKLSEGIYFVAASSQIKNIFYNSIVLEYCNYNFFLFSVQIKLPDSLYIVISNGMFQITKNEHFVIFLSTYIGIPSLYF